MEAEKTTAKKKKVSGKAGKPGTPGKPGKPELNVKQKPKYVNQIAIASVAVVLVGTAVYFFAVPDKKTVPEAAVQKDGVQTPVKFIMGSEDKPMDQSRQPISNKVNIKAIRFIPDQPTATEPIKAEVIYDYNGTAEVSFEYEWKINGNVIENARGNELRSYTLKKKDEVGITVVPVIDGVRAEPFTSAVVIHTLPPTLEMKVLSSSLKRGAPFQIQLKGQGSEGEKLIYALEEPLLEGMTINKDSGKIIWMAEKPGAYKFGASVTDADGNKVVKVFEYQLGSK